MCVSIRLCSINKHKPRERVKNSKSSLPSKVQYLWQLIIIRRCLLKDEFFLEKRNMHDQREKRAFRLSERNVRALLSQSHIKLEICQYKCQVYTSTEPSHEQLCFFNL